MLSPTEDSLLLYQAYYSPEQESHLDPAFIPYHNVGNPTPNLREYPMWCDFHVKHTGSDKHWGLLSWRFHQKTNLPGQVFKDWILKNPGYDLLHIDPFYFKPNQPYPNLWVQGNQWHHGMMDFCSVLFPRLGIDLLPHQIVYKEEQFITANYYIGNTEFWDTWIPFLKNAIEVCKSDAYLNDYMFNRGGLYNGAWVPNFPFVTERLVSLCMYLPTGRNIRILKYPGGNNAE